MGTFIINAILIMQFVSAAACTCPASGNMVVSSSCQITTACLLSQNSRLTINAGRVQVTATGLLSIYGGMIYGGGSLQVDKPARFVIKKAY